MRRSIFLRLLFAVVVTSVVLYSFNHLYSKKSDEQEAKENRVTLAEGKSPPLHVAPSIELFEGFNNETGTNRLIVPNVVRYIRFNRVNFSFVDYVCIKSAWRNQRPDAVYFHTNVAAFEGVYWQRLLDEPDLGQRIHVEPIELPSEVFGQPLSTNWRVWHGSDVARIRMMMKYGGIYLDNDMYVVNSLDKYRHMEIAMGWDEGQFLGSQVIIAHPKARFLPLWLDTYREYHADKWYYNAGERPTVEVLQRRPELLHRVKLKFGVHMLISNLYKKVWNEWRQQDTIHLLINHRSYLDKEHIKEYPEFNEKNIKDYPYTFGIMAREVLDT